MQHYVPVEAEPFASEGMAASGPAGRILSVAGEGSGAGTGKELAKRFEQEARERARESSGGELRKRGQGMRVVDQRVWPVSEGERGPLREAYRFEVEGVALSASGGFQLASLARSCARLCFALSP